MRLAGMVGSNNSNSSNSNVNSCFLFIKSLI